MSRRVIGLLAAIVLALAGTVALVAFVAGAEERALEGQELVEVYVVSDTIVGGTRGEDIDDLVAVEQVPAKVRPSDAVDNLALLRGRVAAVDLQPGEQLIDSRFIELAEFADRATGVQIPDDLVEITIGLEPFRAVGGLLEPGQTVAVFASFDPFELTSTVVQVDGQEVALPSAVADAIDGATPNSTDVILRKILVTAVQEQRSGFAADDDADRLTVAPTDAVFVTLAVPPSDAERLIFSAEFGRVWLAVERETVPEALDPIKTRGNVFDQDDIRRDIEEPVEETEEEQEPTEEESQGEGQGEDGGNGEEEEVSEP